MTFVWIIEAIGGGLCASAGSNVVAAVHHYYEKREAPNNVVPQAHDIVLFILNIVLNLASIACFLLAAGEGPVAVVMPILTGSKLLSSMLFQLSQGMGEWTKSVRVGTLVVVCVAVLLVSDGPPEGGPSGSAVFEMLQPIQARMWMGLAFAVMLSCMVTYHVKGNASANITLCTLAVVVAVSTALGASAGKLLSITSGYERLGAIGLYLLFGAISFGYNALAAFGCDMESFMPLSECVQLYVNCGTGLFVWGDAKRIPSASSYAAIYVLLALGTYLTSSLDIFQRNADLVQACADTPGMEKSLSLAKFRAAAFLVKWSGNEARLRGIGRFKSAGLTVVAQQRMFGRDTPIQSKKLVVGEPEDPLSQTLLTSSQLIPESCEASAVVDELILNLKKLDEGIGKMEGVCGKTC